MQPDVGKRIQEMFATAANQHRSGQLMQAERLYRLILETDPRHADTLHLLGVIALQVGRHAEAVELIGKAIVENDKVPAFYNNLGNAHRARGELQAASRCYEKAFALNPNSIDALYNQGVILQELGKLDEAMIAYQRVIRMKPDHAAAHSNLGNVFSAQGRFEEALACYERALGSRPDFLPALVNRGNVKKAQGRLDAAVESYRRALSLNERYPEAHNNLGLALLEAGKLDEAIASFQRALELHPNYLEAHGNLANVLRERGHSAESMSSYRRALTLDPGNAEARLGLAIAQIPVFADTVAEGEAALASFEAALSELAESIRDSPASLGKSVGVVQPFYLAYRPADVTQALSRYGDLVCDAAGAYFAPRTGTKPDMAKDRTRLGIVCGHVHAGHPVWEILLKGIVAHLTREKFEVFLYHTGSTVDEETAWATARVDRLTQGPKPTADWVDLIRQHRPDILFYPEIGMDPVTCALAAIRLAPLQAASWGHPVTTGLKSIDLFLSGELLESVGADAHYREKLVRLPLTGVCTQAPHVSAQTWEDGASTRRVRFALPHQPIKFDPGDDTLLAAIAKAVGACEFWIALPAKLGWATERLRSRLARVFSEQGLDPESYLRVTPWLSREQFAGFLDAMDVYLDCPAFSGYTTAWQALNRGIPIVTLEGDFLRQRLAAGLLRQIGCIEGIASSRDEYLRIAAEFANESRNFEARASHRRTIREGASKADDNRAAVSALERVLLEAAATHHR